MLGVQCCLTPDDTVVYRRIWEKLWVLACIEGMYCFNMCVLLKLLLLFLTECAA